MCKHPLKIRLEVLEKCWEALAYLKIFFCFLFLTFLKMVRLVTFKYVQTWRNCSSSLGQWHRMSWNHVRRRRQVHFWEYSSVLRRRLEAVVAQCWKCRKGPLLYVLHTLKLGVLLLSDLCKLSSTPMPQCLTCSAGILDGCIVMPICGFRGRRRGALRRGSKNIQMYQVLGK